MNVERVAIHILYIQLARLSPDQSLMRVQNARAIRQCAYIHSVMFLRQRVDGPVLLLGHGDIVVRGVGDLFLFRLIC